MGKNRQTGTDRGVKRLNEKPAYFFEAGKNELFEE